MVDRGARPDELLEIGARDRDPRPGVRACQHDAAGVDDPRSAQEVAASPRPGLVGRGEEDLVLHRARRRCRDRTGPPPLRSPACPELVPPCGAVGMDGWTTPMLGGWPR